MSSRGKIFVIHTKIKSESAWVDQQFLSGRRVTLYLKVAELMETCPRSVVFCKLEPTCQYRKLLHQEYQQCLKVELANKRYLFRVVTFLFYHNHNILPSSFIFVLLLHKGLARHSIQPLPPNVLLNQPNIL